MQIALGGLHFPQTHKLRAARTPSIGVDFVGKATADNSRKPHRSVEWSSPPVVIKGAINFHDYFRESNFGVCGKYINTEGLKSLLQCLIISQVNLMIHR